MKKSKDEKMMISIGAGPCEKFQSTWKTKRDLYLYLSLYFCWISVRFLLDFCWCAAQCEKIQSTWKTQRHSQQWEILSPDGTFLPTCTKEKFSNCIYFSKRFPLFSLEQVDWSLFNADMINLVQPHRTAGKDLKFS